MKLTTWLDGYVEANGIKLHYYRTGGDKPQVVLNHGIADDGLCWTHLVRELESDFDVIMLDARGHGLSESGRGDYLPESRATDVAEAVEKLGLEKPVIGGHSMGADTSIYLAGMYPDLPRAIFMEDPPVPMPGQPMFGGEMGKMNENGLKMMMRAMKLIKTMPRFIGKIVAKKLMPGYPDDEIDPWLDSKKRFSNDLIDTMRDADSNMIQPQFSVLKKITVPALLIMGDRDAGAIVSKAAAEKMHKSLPDLRVVHLTGASHDIRRTRFEGYVEALKNFLGEVYE